MTLGLKPRTVPVPVTAVAAARLFRLCEPTVSKWPPKYRLLLESAIAQTKPLPSASVTLTLKFCTVPFVVSNAARALRVSGVFALLASWAVENAPPANTLDPETTIEKTVPFVPPFQAVSTVPSALTCAMLS